MCGLKEEEESRMSPSLFFFFFLELSERWMKFPYFRQETIVGEAGSVKGMGVRAEGGV